MNRNLIERPDYLKEIEKFRGINKIKILTGVRGSGKTSLLKILQNHLKEIGVKDKNIVYIDFEDEYFEDINYKDLYEFFIEKYKGEKLYLFLDEIEGVKNWPKAVNSIFEEIDADIYIAGSNKTLFQDKSITYLSGRYVLFDIYPLSISEYCNFLGLSKTDNEKSQSYFFKNNTGEYFDRDDIMDLYLEYGGFPDLADLELSDEELIGGLYHIYNKILDKDILKFNPDLSKTNLKQVIKVLTKLSGKKHKLKKIIKKVKKSKFIGDINESIITQYLDAIAKTYLFYPENSSMIREDSNLFINERYFWVDSGLKDFIILNAF